MQVAPTRYGHTMAGVPLCPRMGVMVLVLLALAVAPCRAHAGKGLEALLDSMIVGGKKKTREAMGPGEADAVCRAPQMAAPTEDPAYQLRANGCGPEGLQVQEPFGLHKCCNGHDVCYGTCGVHFEYCERRFDECMQAVCKPYEAAASEMFEQCNTQRITFAGMTTVLGNSFFLNSQRDACQCYPDEQAAYDRYHDAILDLHQKYRKDRATTALVSELMSRYRGKEGQLLYELTRRYAKRSVQFDQGVKDEL